MKQSEIRQTIVQLVHGNLRYCTPNDPICVKQVEKLGDHANKGKEGYTIQSAEEVLEDIIVDLKSLQNRISIAASFNSAQL
jgi:hypothetical protein